MKKILLFVILAFTLIACADKEAEEEAERLKDVTENSYGDMSKITIAKSYENPTKYMSDKEGYEKLSNYSLYYNVKGQQYENREPYSILQIYLYKKNGKLAYFEFSKSNDSRFFDYEYGYQECSVEVTENKMTSKECGDKEGDEFNKILNAINHKSYFDY